MTFVLPYLIYGQPFARNFVEITGNTILAAANAAELQLREKYTKLLNRQVCVAVAEVDFTNRDRETGRPIVRGYDDNPIPRRQYRRRRRAHV